MILEQLKTRAENKCELCGNMDDLKIYDVPPTQDNAADREILVCNVCLQQIEKKVDLNPTHWTCLNESMWSEHPSVQVVAWRMLNRMKDEAWASDVLDLMYLDDENLEWAKKTGDHELSATIDIHRDSNGHPLENGDSVVLVKSLDVKGSTVNARLGTVVKNVRLDPNDTGYIEGKIEGQTIMIKTMFVRKQGANIIT